MVLYLRFKYTGTYSCVSKLLSGKEEVKWITFNSSSPGISNSITQIMIDVIDRYREVYNCIILKHTALKIVILLNIYKLKSLMSLVTINTIYKILLF